MYDIKLEKYYKYLTIESKDGSLNVAMKERNFNTYSLSRIYFNTQINIVNF